MAQAVNFLPKVVSPNKKLPEPVSIAKPVMNGRGLASVRERIRLEFAKARSIAPKGIDPNPLACNLMAAEPEVSTEKRLAPIIKDIPVVVHHPKNGVHDLGEAPKNVDLAKLFDDAVKSLGYAKPKPTTNAAAKEVNLTSVRVRLHHAD